MLPEARHWPDICAHGIERTREGHKRYGRRTQEANALYLLAELRDEWLDMGNYLHWALERLAPGDTGQLRIYIAGPYRAATPEGVDANIRRARDAQAELLRRGHHPLCPHSSMAPYEREYADIPEEAYLSTGLAWLRVAHAVLMLPGWEESEGARVEHEAAQRLKLTIYYSLDEVSHTGGA